LNLLLKFPNKFGIGILIDNRLANDLFRSISISAERWKEICFE
jgi:hypothetical protein